MYFKKEEFACPCCGKNEISALFVDQLNKLREIYKKPIVINSGYRCKDHNNKIKGSENSRHLMGIAADISITNSSDYYLLTKLAFQVGFTGIGFGSNFLHVDIRDSFGVCWTY